MNNSSGWTVVATWLGLGEEVVSALVDGEVELVLLVIFGVETAKVVVSQLVAMALVERLVLMALEVWVEKLELELGKEVASALVDSEVLLVIFGVETAKFVVSRVVAVKLVVVVLRGVVVVLELVTLVLEVGVE